MPDEIRSSSTATNGKRQDDYQSLARPRPMSQRASDIESDDDDDDDSDLDPLVGNQGIAESYPLKELSKLANNEEDERDDDDVVDDDYGYLSPGDDEESFKDEETNGFHKQARFPNGRRRRADSTIPSYTLYTPDEERRVIRKFDRRLVLFMAFLYMLSFLDRSNIGNARIAGLEKDLQLKPSQYEWLLTAFYITYVSFEWMTLLYRVIPAHIYISLCVMSWGLIASLQAVVTSFTAMVILRALLGISEAAFSPGVPFYLSFFYKRDELAFRTGLVVSAAPLATSFAGSLAWLITRLGMYGPIAPWRLLFLVEGFPSVVVAVFAWLFVPDNPVDARYLTSREKEVARLRFRDEKDVKDVEVDQKGIKWREVFETLADPFCYLPAMMFFSCNVAFSSLPVFLPTIIREMGYSTLTSQALSAPPYLISFLMVLLTAHLSDRHQTRSPFIIFHSLLAASGYLLITLAGLFNWGITWRYVGVYPASTGFFSAVTLIITWTINNQQSDSEKGAGLAMLNLIGQCGPLLGTRLYPDRDKPLFLRGMSVCAAFMVFVALLAGGMRIVLMRRNARAATTTAAFRGKGRKEFRYIL